MKDEIREDDPNYSTDNAVYFYTPKYYAFDNFSAFAIELWGHVFPTAEHAYQWKKFNVSNSSVISEIIAARSARDTKVIADVHSTEVSVEWNTVKLTFMEVILRAKLDQHQKVRELLMQTKGKNIFENSPTDAYWGVGPEGDGENHLGKLWMKLRSELE